MHPAAPKNAPGRPTVWSTKVASMYQARKGGGWTAQVNVGGKRRSRTFPKQADARRWARQEEAQADRGEARVHTAASVTMADLIDSYAVEVGEMSYSRAGAIANIAELLGRDRLCDLTVGRFTEFARERAAEGAGPATIAQDFSYIHGVLVTGGPVMDAPYEVSGPWARPCRWSCRCSVRTARAAPLTP